MLEGGEWQDRQWPLKLMMYISYCNYKVFQLPSSQPVEWYIIMSPVMRKPVFGGLHSGETLTGLLSHSCWLESWKFGYSIYRYYTIYGVNNKGADQTARMHRLICIFIVRIWHKQVLSWHSSYIKHEFWTERSLTFKGLGWPWKWGQGHQNLIISFPCLIGVSVQLWSKSTNWFRRYSADKAHF